MKIYEGGVERDATEEEIADITAVRESINAAPPPPARIEWGEVIRAMTPGEAEVFDAAVQNADARFRWLVQKTAYISTDDPDYPMLKAAFDAAFGEDRSNELLPVI